MGGGGGGVSYTNFHICREGHNLQAHIGEEGPHESWTSPLDGVPYGYVRRVSHEHQRVAAREVDEEQDCSDTVADSLHACRRSCRRIHKSPLDRQHLGSERKFSPRFVYDLRDEALQVPV